jgi:hypothetical protein
MKKISVLVLPFLGLLFGASAFADTLAVKITSFRSIDTTGHLGEACGQVTLNNAAPGNSVYIAVTVTSDPGHDPGQYTVLSDPTGAFCTVVATNYGEVSATAWTQGATASAKSAVFKLKGN